MKRVPASRYVCFVLLAALGVWWDLYTKQVVFSRLGFPRGQGPVHEFFGGWLTFRLFTNFNEGALWGLGQGFSWLFALLSVVAVAGVVYWLFVRGAAESKWLTVALALVVAGALGNLYDRLGLHGYINPLNGGPILAVRDFLLFTFGRFDWPVFNFADVFLVTGAIMLVLQSLYVGEAAEETRGEVRSGECKTSATGVATGSPADSPPPLASSRQDSVGVEAPLTRSSATL